MIFCFRIIDFIFSVTSFYIIIDAEIKKQYNDKNKMLKNSLFEIRSTRKQKEKLFQEFFDRNFFDEF